MANISIDVADNEARQDLQDLEDYVDSAAFDKQSLSVTENGTYTAPAGKAYSPVVVDVPNTYAQSDEGKVVSSGALVSQTTRNVTTNGTYDTTTNNSVVVDVAEKQPVISGATIYDYNGEIIATYTPEEFAALESYPAHPTHEYLTPNGYNVALATAQAYAAKYGYVEVGAQYRVTDGKTRLFITVGDDTKDLTLALYIISGSVDVDWGDGSEHGTMTGTSETIWLSHRYAQSGDYIISLDATGIFRFSNDTKVLCKYGADGTSGINRANNFPYICIINHVLIGNNYSDDIKDTLRYYIKMQTVLVPDTITTLGNYSFGGCYSLKALVLPNSITTIGMGIVYECQSLKMLILPHNNFTATGNSMCYYCYSLEQFAVPEGITTIGQYAFCENKNLNFVIVPDSVTTISDYAFKNAQKLTSVIMSNTSNCSYINQYAFQNGNSLKNFDLPNKISNLGQYLFSTCAVTSLTIPATVRNLGRYTIESIGKSLQKIKFLSDTPPSVDNYTGFSNLPTDCIIYVPSGSLSAYTSASNYPDPNTYTYVEY